jgi:hypothetical protein
MARVWKIKDFPEHDEQALADATMMMASKDLYNALVTLRESVLALSITSQKIETPLEESHNALNKAITI